MRGWAHPVKVGDKEQGRWTRPDKSLGPYASYLRWSVEVIT
jgi:hypothetical protein